MVKVGSGWTPPENYYGGDGGTFPGTLIGIGVVNDDGTFTPGARRQIDGQFGRKDVQDWRWAFEDGSLIDSMVGAPRIKDGEEIIHPQSKYYAYVTSLRGRPLEEGLEFDPQQQLIGRMALITVQRNESGFPQVTNVGAMPTNMLSQKVAEATGAPMAQPAVSPPPPAAAPPAEPPASTPLRETVAAGAGSDLPFDR